MVEWKCMPTQMPNALYFPSTWTVLTRLGLLSNPDAFAFVEVLLRDTAGTISLSELLVDSVVDSVSVLSTRLVLFFKPVAVACVGHRLPRATGDRSVAGLRDNLEPAASRRVVLSFSNPVILVLEVVPPFTVDVIIIVFEVLGSVVPARFVFPSSPVICGLPRPPSSGPDDANLVLGFLLSPAATGSATLVPLSSPVTLDFEELSSPGTGVINLARDLLAPSSASLACRLSRLCLCFLGSSSLDPTASLRQRLTSFSLSDQGTDRIVS